MNDNFTRPKANTSTPIDDVPDGTRVSDIEFSIPLKGGVSLGYCADPDADPNDPSRDYIWFLQIPFKKGVESDGDSGTQIDPATALALITAQHHNLLETFVHYHDPENDEDEEPEEPITPPRRI